MVAAKLRTMRLSRFAMARFYGTRGLRPALLWGVILGVTVVSSAYGFITAYNTEASRQVLAKSFENNMGLKVLLGQQVHIGTVAGFTAWRSLGLIIIVGAIWGLLASTKLFRGEEQAGRWEVFLAGQTSMSRAVVNGLLALLSQLAVLFVVISVFAVATSQIRGVDFTAPAALYFALTAVASVAMFMSFGTFASQIMPIRARAAAMTAGFFGLCFATRALGNVVDQLHWLLNVSPLGWVQQAQPLVNSRPLWLAPTLVLSIALSFMAYQIAGRRDIYASVLADNDTSPPDLRMLGGVLGMSARLTRASTLGWLASVGVISFVFGFVAKSAGETFSQSSQSGGRIISKLIAQQSTTIGVTTFLGIIFMLAMLILMAFAANSVSAIREDEAVGYLDNLLVRAVSRTRWLTARLSLTVVAIVGGGVLAGSLGWLSSVLQDTGVSYGLLLNAGINSIAPAIFVLGLSTLTFAFVPRLTAAIGYGALAWSFLVQIVGGAVNLNHWALDTSLLHHIALAPASAVNWRVFWAYVACGLACMLIGMWYFTRRDLQNE